MQLFDIIKNKYVNLKRKPMNKIEFPRKSYDGTLVSQKDVESWYRNEFEADILQRLNSIDSSAYSCLQKRTLKWIMCSIHRILIASPKWMERVSNIVNNYCKDMFRYRDANNRWKSTVFGEEIKKAFNYGGYRNNKLILLAEKLNVKSCPYCNMHYTLFAENGNHRDKLAKFQFDHFFDKTDYPFLSMSLYNLIPSCAICNHGKSTGHLSLKFHPYDSSIADQFHFEVANPLSLYSGGKIDRIELDMIPDNVTQAEIKEFDDIFHLQTLYRRHGDIAQEVFDKAYEESYYLNTSSFNFLNCAASDYMLRLTYGAYMDKDEIEKRPMSKFIQDLRKQALAYKPKGL